MKKTSLLVVLALLSGASVAWTLAPRLPAQESSDEDSARFAQKIRECLEVSGGKQQAKASLDEMVTQFKKLPGLDPRFVKRFQELVTGDDLAELNVPIWMRYLEEADVDAMIAFYKSTPGRKFVDAQPAIQQEAIVAGQKFGQEMAEQVLAELRD